VLNEEDKEDLVLGLMMEETDYNDTIDANEFIKMLIKNSLLRNISPKSLCIAEDVAVSRLKRKGFELKL
jgi:hypothetical protein